MARRVIYNLKMVIENIVGDQTVREDDIVEGSKLIFEEILKRLEGLV